MPIETVFLACNYGVIPFWLLLVLAPRWIWTRRLVHSGLPALLLVPVYAILLWGDQPGPQGASVLTLEGVSRIFTTPWTITACWIHYLVVDLFVGAWLVRDAARRKIPHLLVVPCLVITLLFAPVGYALYLALRAVMRRAFTLVEETASIGGP
jgi:hypothetical protein